MARRASEPTKLPVVDDAELVDRARRGERGARELLYRRHVRRVAGIIHRLMGGDRDLEDLVQDTFVHAFDKLSTLQDSQAFAGWILRIATGKVLDTLRRRSFLRRVGLWSRETFDESALISPHASAETALELRNLYSLLARFPTDERVALVLRRVEELTHEEMANVTGWSVATVKRRINDAEARFARLLQESR